MASCGLGGADSLDEGEYTRLDAEVQAMLLVSPDVFSLEERRRMENGDDFNDKALAGTFSNMFSASGDASNEEDGERQKIDTQKKTAAKGLRGNWPDIAGLWLWKSQLEINTRPLC